MLKKFLGKKDKKEEAKQQSVKQQSLMKKVIESKVQQNPDIYQEKKGQRMDSFADLMGDEDEEEKKEASSQSSQSQSDLLSQMNSARRPSRVNNRIGTLLPDAFLGDVLSRRENELEDLDHDSYFEVQRESKLIVNTPSQQDFMDSFFTSKPAQTAPAQPPINQSSSQHNSFEIVGDDHVATYVADIRQVDPEPKKDLEILVDDQQDTKKIQRQELILQKQSTPDLNVTNTSSELVKSDQAEKKSQEISSSSSNQKKSSEFVGSSPFESQNNSSELQRSSSNNSSSDLQRSESLPNVIYQDFENRPTAQFVKQQDFVSEKIMDPIEEPEDFQPKVYLTLPSEQVQASEQVQVFQLFGAKVQVTADSQVQQLNPQVLVAELVQEQIQIDIPVVQQAIQEQVESIQTGLEEAPLLEIGFEREIEVDAETPSQTYTESLMSSQQSFEQTGILSDSYFDRKRIYESSITEGSYVAPVVQRRDAFGPLTKSQKNEESSKPQQEMQESTPLVTELNDEKLDQKMIILNELMQEGVVELETSPAQRPVSVFIPISQRATQDLDKLAANKQAEGARQAVKNTKQKKKQNLLDQMRVTEIADVKDQNSSEDFLTDKSFQECASLNSEEIEFVLQVQEQRAALENQHFLDDLANFQDNTNEPIEQIKVENEQPYLEEPKQDFLKLISQNVNLYKIHAESKFNDLRKKNQQFPTKNDTALQKVVSDPESLAGGVNKILGPTEKKTCIAVQDNFVLFGTSAGILYAFDKNSGLLFGTHKEDGKEFIDNSVTCIDVHPFRSKYVVIGFQKGQISLVDLTEMKKNLKLIKDHHKKPIVSVKFCDWAKEKPHSQMGPDHKCNDCQDVKAWMFVSVDTEGKVVVNTVTNISFGLLYANDYVLNDPAKFPELWQFEGVAARFSSKKYPNDSYNDNSTVIALACAEAVVIRIIGEKSQEQRMVVERPMRYPSDNLGDVAPINSRLPCISWGYGKTPFFNFQVFPLLAIGWGPIIQIVVFRDINGDNKTNEDFQLDGHYILAQSIKSQADQVLDLTIQSLSFIEESLLIATTSNGEVRVMYTEKFKDLQYIQPQHLQQISLDTMDSRCKYMSNGSPLTAKQIDVEMERVTILQEATVQTSMYGIESAQTCQVWKDRMYYLAQNQRVYQLQHLNWLDNLLSLNQIAGSSSWINVFKRALNIYTGKLRGLRIEGDSEQQKKENMRTQLKAFIETLVSQTIAQFKLSANSENKESQTTLIRVGIEFSIEIGEPIFLFEALQDQFKRAGLSDDYAIEIKPYILSGTFSECVIPEKVLDVGIIQLFKQALANDQNEVLVENFEKILLNLRFDSCSKAYIQSLIQLCHDYHFSTGIVYLSLQCYGEQGPLHALSELRDFYLMAQKSESKTSTPIKPTVNEVYQALNLPVSSQERVAVESSSAYIGLKLLWITRQFLLGKKVPRGLFTNYQKHILLHDVLDFVTQPEMIELFLQIDAAAYFQILSIVFTNPSPQFTQIQQGRPQQKTPYQNLPQKQSVDLENSAPESLTHEIIIKRVSSYFQDRDISSIVGTDTGQMRLDYLCFIANIASSFEDSSNIIDAKLYYEVALELLRHCEKLTAFNRSALRRRMTNKQLNQRLSNSALDDEKHLNLTEEMFLTLIQRAKPVLADQSCLKQMLESAICTNFLDVKLILYDLNNDYLNCLKLFMQNKDEKKKPKLSVKTKKGEIDGFEWIRNRYESLDHKAHEDSAALQQLQTFQREIFSQAFYLVKANTIRTIQLCEAIFKSAHLEVIEKMQDEQQWQLVYIQHLIELKREDIKKLVSGHTPGQRKAGEFEKWKVILGLHIRLICALEPSRVTAEIEKVVKDNFYPMEECLKTCSEFKQLEACALINRKLGNYSESIELYLRVMSNGLTYEDLKKELFYYNKDRQKHIDLERERLTEENKARLSQDIRQTDDVNLVKLLIQNAVKTVVKIQRKDKLQDHYLAWVSKFGKNIELMDRVIDRISSICRNHPREVLEDSKNESYMHVLQALFSILFHPSMRKKAYCKRHMKLKIVSFCRSILEYISFNRLLQAATNNTKHLKYKAIKELVNEVFCDKTQEIQMCETVESNAQSDLHFFQGIAIRDKGTGVKFTQESLICQLCELSVHEQIFKSQLVLYSKQNDIVVFDCQNKEQEKHACHARCLKKLIQDEQSDGSKKAPLNEKQLQKLYRCPTCNPKNQLVLMNAEKLDEVVQVETSGSVDPLLDKDDEVAVVHSSRRTLRIKPASEDQKLIQKQKQMRKFEETILMDECLSRSDFSLD